MASVGDVQDKHVNVPMRPTRSESDMDLRPCDLVSRLLAATPPYLYAPLLHPTSFFFSEMLRGLVAAKAGQQGGHDGPHHHAPPARRPRKRTWRDAAKQQHGVHGPHGLAMADKPLELTTPRAPPLAGDEKLPPPSGSPKPPPLHPPLGMLPPLGSPPLSGDMLLPPGSQPPLQPPLWYPPPALYPLPHQPPLQPLQPLQPPYPIDPLHFFIDLRVSGHIKAKEGEQKHCSAFSVPLPRGKQPPAPSSPTPGEAPLSPAANGGPPPAAVSPGPGPNYVLQNLSRIYDDVRPAQRQILDADVKPNNNNNNNNSNVSNNNNHNKEDEEEKAADGDMSDEEKEKKKKKDIRALLGLELVVDYVKHRKTNKQPVSSDDDDSPQSSPRRSPPTSPSGSPRTSPARSPPSRSPPSRSPPTRCSPPRSPGPRMSPVRPGSPPMFLHQHPLSGALGHLQGHLGHLGQLGQLQPPFQAGHMHHHFMREAANAANAASAANALNLHVPHH